MGAAENKQLLQRIFAELANANARPLVAAMANDFRWTVSGSNAWSGTYAGKTAVVKDLFGALGRRMERIVTIGDRFIAEGDHVVVQAHGANVTKEGTPYNNMYCFVFRVADGKLAEVTEYMDTELVTAALGKP